MTCFDKYLDTIPWPQFAFAVLLGFTVGALLGRAYGRRHPAPPRPSRERKGVAMIKLRRKWNALSLGSDWLSRHPRLSTIYDRVTPVLVVFALVASVWASLSTWENSRQDRIDNARRDAENTALIEANQANAVTSCENANESRRATLSLWTFLFSLSDPRATDQEKQDVQRIRAWIGKLYAERDCSDLSRKYVIPPPPVIGARR